MNNILKFPFFYLLVGSYCLKAQEEKNQNTPFKNSLIINEYNYDGIFSVIQDSPDNYVLQTRITPDSLKGKNPVPKFAQAWQNTVPITNSYENRFFHYSQELDHELLYEVNGIQVSKRYPIIRPKDKKYNHKVNTEDDLKAIDVFDLGVKNGTNWLFKFADNNNIKKQNDKTNFEFTEKVNLYGFPEIVELQPHYKLEKNKDITITFPQIKNADVIYFEFICNNAFGCERQAPSAYQMKGLLKAIEGHETSITLKSYEINIMGSNEYTLNVYAIKAALVNINNNFVLLQNISQNKTSIKLY